jgi:alkylation response protein AidB-like acyl-CoA dehydrogenase
VGGDYLSEHQTIQLKLSRMHMLTEALRAYVLRTAWERDQAARGDEAARNSVIPDFVMAFSRDAGRQVTALNIDIHGAAGEALCARAQKLYRDTLTSHVAGDIVQRLTPMKRLLQ